MKRYSKFPKAPSDGLLLYERHLLKESYSFVDMQSVYSTAQSSKLAGLVSYTGHTLDGSFSSAEMQSLFSTNPAESARPSREAN